MEHQHTENDLKNIAKQLACPEGLHGIKTGELMNINNIGMTHAAIDALDIQNGNVVLEIGHGNGGHIGFLLSQADDIQYFGADISETIIAEAKKINAGFIQKGNVHFQLTEANALPYPDTHFDRIFTVNTLYFWSNPLAYLQELKRVLKPGGKLVLCFADKNFMEKLPFTPYGFALYDVEKVVSILSEAGFNDVKAILNTEEINSNAGFKVTRDYHIVAGANI